MLDVLDLARWQFAITTIYHFFFVPVTVGLSAIVAGLQTAWVVTGKGRYLRLTRFFGKVFVINFVMGIVTGLIQQFQFGMNWSAYSRFVGDVLGVPLAVEGLLAFFLEATFLGLWMFGWQRLPKLIHLACIHLVAIGALISAYVILSVNSWMQHPVGHRIDPETGRAYLADLGALLTSETAVAAGLHTAVACYLTGGALVTGIAFWRLARLARTESIPIRESDSPEVAAFRAAATVGAGIVLLATPAFVLTGDHQMKLIAEHQPMKLAAAEGLFDTTARAPFSVLTLGDAADPALDLEVMPGLLSWLSYGDVDATVEGIDDVQREYAERYGPGDYVPNVPMTYWSFRAMIGLGSAVSGAAAIGLFLLYRRPHLLTRGSVAFAAVTVPFLPLAANTAGWLFTEGGRQPWLVYGLFRTADGVSPETTAAQVGGSLVVFTLLYAATALVNAHLLRRAAAEPLPLAEPPGPPGGDPPVEPADRPMALSY